jgi:hypothetical protein
MATTSPTSYTLPALQEKVKQAAAVLAAIPGFWTDKKHPKANVEKDTQKFVWDALAKVGIYQDAESHELLMSADCDKRVVLQVFFEAKVPLIRANRIVGILKPEPIVAEKKMVVTIDPADKPVGQWTDQMLVNELNPGHDHTDEAAAVVDSRAFGRAFVVYDDEEAGTVNIPMTMKLLGAAKRGKTPVHYSVGDCLKKLYRAIERPNVVFFQCPLHPDTLLMEDYCDTCGQTWDGKMTAEALQFVRLVQEAGEAPERAPDVRCLIVLAKAGVEALMAEYPKVAVTFKERKAEGTLPNLRQRSSAGRAVSDPMAPGKRY